MSLLSAARRGLVEAQAISEAELCTRRLIRPSSPVLKRTGERRKYFYRFENPMLQPLCT